MNVGSKTFRQIMEELGGGATAYKFSAANGKVLLSVDGIYGSLARA